VNEDGLVRKYRTMVFNLALRLTGDRAAAEDLAQESLLKAIKGWTNFRGESDPGTWLYRITVNAWKNRVRDGAKSRWLRFFAPDGEVAAEPLDVASQEPGPEAAAVAAEKKKAIERALEKLTPEERAVLVLRELDGRSYSEIAESLDVPLGTVKSRLARAREILADELAPEEEPDAARDR
jgi:RNA polymerase sigma-70 factor, ECF subfamily